MSIYTKTTNDATAVEGTGSPTLDLFFNIGSSRSAQDRVKELFDKSCLFDMDTTAAILMWVRDIRGGGAGERQSFRTCLRELIVSDSGLATKIHTLLNLTITTRRFSGASTGLASRRNTGTPTPAPATT